MTRDEFVEIATEYIDQYFPKGKTDMRGEAMVMIGMLTYELMRKGVLEP